MLCQLMIKWQLVAVITVGASCVDTGAILELRVTPVAVVYLDHGGNRNHPARRRRGSSGKMRESDGGYTFAFVRESIE